MASLTQAIQVLHDRYGVPHIVITSVTLPAPDQPSSHLSVVGSSKTSAGQARLFKIVFPSIDCYFSGTGDMFAALMVSRVREAVYAVPGLRDSASWLSGDDIAAQDLPLASAAEKVLASMHEVLSKTKDGMERIAERTRASMSNKEKGNEKKMHLVKSKAAEVQLVRNLDSLRAPTVEFPVKAM